MAKDVVWDLKKSNFPNTRKSRRVSISQISDFFGGSTWCRISAYLIQSNRYSPKTGMTSKEIVDSMISDYPGEVRNNLQRSVDRTLEKMVNSGQVISTDSRPRRFRLNSKKSSIRDIQNAIGHLVQPPHEVEVASSSTWDPEGYISSKCERLVIGILEKKKGSGDGWTARSEISEYVGQHRQFTDPRISQVLSRKEGSFGLGEMGMIEERKEGWYKSYRLTDEYSSMSADEAYTSYLRWKLSDSKDRFSIYSRWLANINENPGPE